MLPNAVVATLTFLPFILCSSITTLTSLDFLGFGLPLGSPSLGELLLQGKNNLQAPWLGITAFLSVAVLLSLLILLAKPCAMPLTPIRRYKMTQPLLSIDNLSIAFSKQGETRTVVTDLSLQIQRGETLALVGNPVQVRVFQRSLSCGCCLHHRRAIRRGYSFHGSSLLHADEHTLRGIRGNKIAMIFQSPWSLSTPAYPEKQLYEVLSLHRGMRKEAARGNTGLS